MKYLNALQRFVDNHRLIITLALATWMFWSTTGCAVTPAPQIVKIEPPPPPKPQIIIPPDPLDGLAPVVRAAIKSNQTPTLRDGIAVLFPYNPNHEYAVYCQPLRATEIRLNPDEWTDRDNVILGDSVRWAVKIGMQAVMVEPLGTAADLDMTTNLVIHTNRRSYHLNLRLSPRYMEAIQFYYPLDIREQQAARKQAQLEAKE